MKKLSKILTRNIVKEIKDYHNIYIHCKSIAKFDNKLLKQF